MMAAKRYRPHRAKPKPKVTLTVVGYDGKFELGFRDVVDPMNNDTGTRTITVSVNKRNDLLLFLRGHGKIDDAQVIAGQRFRALYEQAEIGGARGIDHSRPVVDGGHGASAGAGDLAASAIRDMAETRRAVGDAYFRLLVTLIGEGQTMTDYATRLNGGHYSRLMHENVSCMLRAALDGLILFWGVGKR